MNTNYSISKTVQDELISNLKSFVEDHLPLGRAMNISVIQFDGQQLSLGAPLALNNNDKGLSLIHI